MFNFIYFTISEVSTSQAVLGNQADYEKLATELTDMANTLAPYVSRLDADDVSGNVARIVKWVPDPSPGIRSY